jgi:hypothetical protein
MSDLPLFVINKKILNAVPMTANITSEIVDVAEVSGFAVHAIWTGAPVGNIDVCGSNDGVNFVSINTQATAGTSGQLLLNEEMQHYRYMWVEYAFTSGTGSLTCYVSAKRS